MGNYKKLSKSTIQYMNDSKLSIEIEKVRRELNISYKNSDMNTINISKYLDILILERTKRKLCKKNL